ncbi:MAG TPA: peptidase C25, partial [Thermoplasmatales archaeon]|nr:peptidase C25 [Thermoplasmatales archaeon]
MKRIIVAILVGFLLVSGVGVVAISQTGFEKEDMVVHVSDPIIVDKGEFVTVEVKELTNYLSEPGKPLLPLYIRTFTFPVGTKILSVDVKSSYREIHLAKKIEPAPSPVPLNMVSDVPPTTMDLSVYESNSLYPSQEYSVRESIGLDHGERVIFLTVCCYSQYKPIEDLLYIPDNIRINIEYDPPEDPLFTNSLYDLLIITDEKFLPYLEPLVEHKNRMGVSTRVMTVQEIYPKYNGRDDAEDVKLAIADAIKCYGVKYVLLFGGHKGQTDEWWVPVRYSHNFDGAYSHKGVPYDPKYLCDLYFADVFKIDRNGNPIFDDWDSNGNGVFAEYDYFNPSIKDEMDFHPDVYVGRIPVRYSWEAETIVDKIITYETSASESWFKHAVVCSGDTFPPSRGATNPVYEGEREVGLSASYLESAGFTVDRLFTSTGTFSCKEDLQRAVNVGCGFVHVAGHGSPSVWGNFLPMAKTEDEFVVGFSIMNIRKFT